MVAAAVRAGYVALAAAVAGDAVNYAWVAQTIAGAGSRGDPFWSNLFCFWQALFHAAGLQPPVAAIASTFLPGTALVVPVVWLARRLFDHRVAWIAGLLTAVHPRLVEFSANGYSESFYLLAFAVGTAGAVAVVAGARWRDSLVWGIGFGVYAAVRPEALAAFAGSIGAVALAWLWHDRLRERGRRALLVMVAVAGCLAVVAGYGGLAHAHFGPAGVLQKAGNLGKRFSEQLDWREAARETYGDGGLAHGAPRPRPPLGDVVHTLLQRMPRNLVYVARRLPGVLASPAAVLVLLLPLAGSGRRSGPPAWLPLLWMGAFPLAFFPLIQVEPRLLLPLLVPVHVLAAASMVLFADRWLDGRARRYLVAATTLALMLLSVAVTAWRGITVERRFHYQRLAASCVEVHVPPGELLVGGGYGFVTTTAFLSDHPATPRLWTDDPSALAPAVAAAGGRWLLLYQGFLERANPELLSALDDGLPGFSRVAECSDEPGARVVLYRLIPP